jgi:hypothetical protein
MQYSNSITDAYNLKKAKKEYIDLSLVANTTTPKTTPKTTPEAKFSNSDVSKKKIVHTRRRRLIIGRIVSP